MSDWLWHTLGPSPPEAFRVKLPGPPRARAAPLGIARGEGQVAPIARRHRVGRPAVRRATPLPEILSAPAGLASLHRLTRGQLSWKFFFRGSLEARALAFLAEPGAKKSQRTLDEICDAVLTRAHACLFDVLQSANEGGAPRRLPWSSHRCADALRIRHVRRRPPAAETAGMTWYGVLRWAGREALDRDDLQDVPPNACKSIGVAIASVSGYRRAAELLPAWFPEGSRQRWVSFLVMRVALEEKLFLPELLTYMVPPVAGPLRRNAWVPLAAALRRAARARHEAGTVFLLAATLATVFRRALRQAAPRARGLELDLPDWGRGTPSLPESSLPSLFEALAELGWSPWADRASQRIQHLLRIDLEAVERSLKTLLGNLEPPALWFLYLDDALLNASLFRLVGNTLSAGIHGRAARGPAAHGLRYRLERTSVRIHPELLWFLVDRERGAADEVEDLLGSPDPSVALGTPLWALETELPRAASFALKEGRKKEFSAVRALLHRRDLRARLEPFWLVRPQDAPNLLRALRWLGRDLPYPSADEWLPFLELLADEATTTWHERSKKP